MKKILYFSLYSGHNNLLQNANHWMYAKATLKLETWLTPKSNMRGKEVTCQRDNHHTMCELQGLKRSLTDAK